SGCYAAPVLQPSKHDLDPVAPLVPALVVFDSFLALLSTWDTDTYPFVFQRFSEPVGVIAAISKEPIDTWQAVQKRPCADVIADLTGGDEQVQRPPMAVADGVQLGVHAAFGAPDQAATPPFFTPMLVAVRWALR